MFDIVFGATLRLDISIVHLLIKDLYLEKWKRQFLGAVVETELAGSNDKVFPLLFQCGLCEKHATRGMWLEPYAFVLLFTLK